MQGFAVDVVVTLLVAEVILEFLVWVLDHTNMTGLVDKIPELMLDCSLATAAGAGIPELLQVRWIAGIQGEAFLLAAEHFAVASAMPTDLVVLNRQFWVVRQARPKFAGGCLVAASGGGWRQARLQIGRAHV